MSLLPVYVKADDGWFYLDPVLGGNDFYICFDEEEDPELVIKNKAYSDALLKQITEEYGLSNVRSARQGQERMFGGRFAPAVSFFCDICLPLQVGHIKRYVKKTQEVKTEAIIFREASNES